MLLPLCSLLATTPYSPRNCGAPLGRPLRGTASTALLRVKLDDELLLDRHRDVVARRRGLDGALEAALVEVEPGRDAAAVHCLERLVDAHDLAALFLHRDDVA